MPPAASLGGGFTAEGTRGRKFAGVFETGLGDTGESLVIDPAQFWVGEGETLRISDKSGHLSVGAEDFCPGLVR